MKKANSFADDGKYKQVSTQLDSISEITKKFKEKNERLNLFRFVHMEAAAVDKYVRELVQIQENIQSIMKTFTYANYMISIDKLTLERWGQKVQTSLSYLESATEKLDSYDFQIKEANDMIVELNKHIKRESKKMFAEHFRIISKTHEQTDFLDKPLIVFYTLLKFS